MFIMVRAETDSLMTVLEQVVVPVCTKKTRKRTGEGPFYDLKCLIPGIY